MSEENVIKNKYPLLYKDLLDKLRNKYTNFKINQEFYTIKKNLEDSDKHGEKFCKTRYLDPIKKQGSKKTFYSTEIIKEFDKHYTRRKK